MRVNIHHSEDGVFANLPAEQRAAYPGAGSNTIITDSYFHDFIPRSFNNKDMDNAKRANGHIDAVQTEGGATNTQLIHNTVKMNVAPYTKVAGQNDGYVDSATGFWNGGSRDLKRILVTRNLFAGGGFTHYAYDRTGKVNGTCGDTANAAVNDCGSVTDIRFIDNRYSTLLRECIGGYGVWFSRGTPTGGWAAPGNTRSGNKVIENGQSVDESATPTRNDGTHCN